MKSFKEFGIQSELHSFTGDKIKVVKIINREIIVRDFIVEDSKFKGKCLKMQIEVDDKKHIVFTGSKHLIDMINKVPRDGFPFKATIVEEDECYKFK